jgi:hypothetical protein
MQKIKNIFIKNTYKKTIQIRGFTMGLALIIVSSMLLISVSISTLLMRDIKNSASNIKSSIAYNLAESGLDCAYSLESNVKYFDNRGDVVTGVFPTSTIPFKNPASYDALNDAITEGFASKDWSKDNFDDSGTPINDINKTYNIDTLKCFGVNILSDIKTGSNITDISTTSLKNIDTGKAPKGFVGGVVTHINIKKDLSFVVNMNTPSGSDSFKKYLQGSCVTLDIYATSTGAALGPVYEKLIVGRAFVPCEGNNKVERVLVRYVQ